MHQTQPQGYGGQSYMQLQGTQGQLQGQTLGGGMQMMMATQTAGQLQGQLPGLASGQLQGLVAGQLRNLVNRGPGQMGGQVPGMLGAQAQQVQNQQLQAQQLQTQQMQVQQLQARQMQVQQAHVQQQVQAGGAYAVGGAPSASDVHKRQKLPDGGYQVGLPWGSGGKRGMRHSFCPVSENRDPVALSLAPVLPPP